MDDTTEPISLTADPDRLLTYAEVAAITRVPERTVRTWPRKGLVTTRLGRHVRVACRDLSAWLHARRDSTG